MALDYDLTDEEQIKLYLKNIETEYSYQCLSEKEPDGCHRLADFMNSTKGDQKLGSKLFKKNCDEYNYGHSCFKYAGNRMFGKGVDKDSMDGVKYFEKACEAGFHRGCSNAGLLYIDGRNGVPKDIEKGLKYLKLACDNHRGEACATLGTAYLLGKYELTKDTGKATSYLEKACELQSQAGCFNLSRMYKTGDGVMRNDALAEKYRDKAVKIKQMYDGSNAAQINLGRTS